MDVNQQIGDFSSCRQTLTLDFDPSTPRRDPEMESAPMVLDPATEVDVQEDSIESMLCVSGPRIVMSGLKESDCKGDAIILVNAGGCSIQGDTTGDTCFEGGDVIGTDETIIDGGDFPSMYQSARYGNFHYKFDDLSPGEYFVDLHFAEIVNTNGPKGIRVFDVYVQDEKILSDFDIYAVAGANKPLQLVDIRASVIENGTIIIKFEGKSGTPTVCGLSVRRAPKLSAPLVKSEHLICNKCATEMDMSPTQNRARSMKVTMKYEKKIQELTTQCKLKSDECYEAWMSLTAANEQLHKLTMELDNKLFQLDNLEQALEKQTVELRGVTKSYEHDKKVWVAAIRDLEEKLKAMRQEHSQLLQDAHECATSIPDLNKMIIAVQTLVAQCEELKIKYSEEMAKRKKLFNQVQEAKGNIRVFCRCRPLSKEEVSSGYGTIVDFEAAKDGDLAIMTGGPTKKTFKFDRVYTPKDDQADVYADASPMVTSVLDGYNVCIFAYGQTGTGKTFTMEGTQPSRGVNYRTLEELFKIAGERKDTFTYKIYVSVLEVYNEQIRDLLATSPSSKKLEVRQAGEGFHHVPGIVEAKVESVKEAWDVLQAGSNARVVGSNNVNEHSSRSHCMLCIMVSTKNLMNGDCTRSKLWLVDLAGSERLTKTDAQGERLKEAQNINRSLSALGDVISALASKSSHIPYRNSKLTHLLQDSLGGDSKALMFVQISPSENDLGETLSSLNFASRVRGIELGPVRKQVDTGELQKIKQMLDKTRQECRLKDESIRKLEESCQNLENKVRGKEQICRNLQDKNKELECQLAESMKGKEEACSMLQQKVKETEYKLKEQQHSESMMLQQKVKELDCKLRERAQSDLIAEQKVKELELKRRETESMLEQKVKELELKRRETESMLEQKVKDFEYKLNEQRHIAEQKIKELEFKLKEKQQSESMLEQRLKEFAVKLQEVREPLDPMILVNSADASRVATPVAGKEIPKDESTSEPDPRILRSSKTVNRPAMGQVSVLLKGPESLHEIKRKRSLPGNEHENNILVPAALVQKVLPPETQRVRKLDHARAYGRITRTPRVATQKQLSHNRAIKDQAGLSKEREKTRGWC